MTDHIVVDCRGMQCPAPILEIAKTARRAATQPAWLEILADDDDFPTDLEAWCRSARAELRTMGRAENYYRAWVALNGAGPIPERAAPAERSGSVVAVPAAPPSAPARSPAPDERVAAAAAETNGRSSNRGFLTLDLNGFRAPHPIMRLSQALLQHPGRAVVVRCDDPAFMTDLAVWASSARVRVVTLEQHEGDTRARLQLPGPTDADSGPPMKTAPETQRLDGVNDQFETHTHGGRPGGKHANGAGFVDARRGPDGQDPNQGGVHALEGASILGAPAAAASQSHLAVAAQPANRCTLLVLRNDFESLMAALLTAHGARAQNMEVVIYFSFWGVNLLRGERPRRDLAAESVSFLQRLMKWMMPRGPQRQKMSKMHMGGAGRGMMEYFMRRNNVMSLSELIDQAVELEVRFIVCTMSMGIMGIQKRDLMDLPNMEFGGVTAFVENARDSRMSLVF